MRAFGLLLVVTCLAAAPAIAQPDVPPGHSPAVQRAREYAANRELIEELTRRRASLDRRIAHLRLDLQALIEWQRRCRAAPANCPPAPEPPFPMVGMAPGHAGSQGRGITLAMLQQQRATIARLREDVRSRTELAGRFESRIAALRGQ